MLTAEQKVRLALTGSPDKEPVFQHEGEEVVRWITGGTLPDLYVYFLHRDTRIVLKCAVCQEVIGDIPDDNGGDSASIIGRLRVSHRHEPAKERGL